MTKKEGSVSKGDPGKIKHGSVIILGDSVRVWGSVGVTIAVTDDPPQFLRFEFGHERISKNGTQEEIRKTATLIDEFNEKELDKRLKKYRRLFRSAEAVEPTTDAPTARERAKARIAEGNKPKAKGKKKKAK
jgi:hypothetical protein